MERESASSIPRMCQYSHFFLESMFIYQATRNGTRPGTPEGAEPALQYSQYPARLVSTMSADARQSEPLAAGRGWGETSTSASAAKHERARMPLPVPGAHVFWEAY